MYERKDSPSYDGMGIGYAFAALSILPRLICRRIQRNGARVLSQIPGLLEYLRAYNIDEWEAYSMVEGDKGFLGTSDQLKRFREKDGFGTMAGLRPMIQRSIIEFVENAGIRIIWGHQLSTLEQSQDSVILTFANGVKDTFSFVVGCDGLHSNTRTCLFGEQPATYTGLSQVSAAVPR